MSENYKRVRNRYLNFHVSEEELQNIMISAKVVQMSKQDFIIKTLNESKIVLQNGVYYSDRLSFELHRLINQLNDIEDKNEVEKEIYEIVKFLKDGERKCI